MISSAIDSLCDLRSAQGRMKTYYFPTPKAMKSVKKKIREVVRAGQHWDLPRLDSREGQPDPPRVGQLLQDRATQGRHFLSVANYTSYTLCIMLRKKHKKRSKGWRDHPPSWFYRLPRAVQVVQPARSDPQVRSDLLRRRKAAGPKAVGKPCAGKLHARFDEGPLGRSPQTSGLLYSVSLGWVRTSLPVRLRSRR